MSAGMRSWRKHIPMITTHQAESSSHRDPTEDKVYKKVAGLTLILHYFGRSSDTLQIFNQIKIFLLYRLQRSREFWFLFCNILIGSQNLLEFRSVPVHSVGSVNHTRLDVKRAHNWTTQPITAVHLLQLHRLNPKLNEKEELTYS